MGNNIKSNAVVLLIFSLLSKALAFGREILLAYYFGVGLMLDAFNTGITFSNTLLFIFSGGAFIPILISFALAVKSREQKRELNGFLLILFVLSIIISLATVITAPYFVVNVNEAIRGDVILVLRLTAFSSTFYALSSIIRALLNSKGEYRFSGAQDFVMIFIILVGIFISQGGNSLVILSLSFLIASMFRVLVQIPMVYRYREDIFTGIEVRRGAIMNYASSLFPMMFATLIPQVMIIATRLLSSQIGEGVVSGLSYADRTSDLIKSIVAYSLGAVIVAPMAQHLQDGKYDRFMKLLNRSLLFAFFVSIPIFFIFMLWGKEIIYILYERGSFTSQATVITGTALSYYSIATLFSSPIFILMSAMYSSKNWKGVFLTTSIAVFVGLMFMLMTYKSMGVIGIAISLGIYSAITFTLLYVIILKMVGGLYKGDFLYALGKLFVVNLISFTLGYLMYGISPFLLLIIPVIYILISIITKEPLFKEIVDMVIRYLWKRGLKDTSL